MRVARTVSLTQTVIEEVPDPQCGPGEVVCRVLPCATCGSCGGRCEALKAVVLP